MEVHRNVHPECPNSGNAFHECSSKCFDDMGSGEARKEKTFFGFGKKYPTRSTPGSPARVTGSPARGSGTPARVSGDKSPPPSYYYSKKNTESVDNRSSSSDENIENFQRHRSPAHVQPFQTSHHSGNNTPNRQRAETSGDRAPRSRLAERRSPPPYYYSEEEEYEELDDFPDFASSNETSGDSLEKPLPAYGQSVQTKPAGETKSLGLSPSLAVYFDRGEITRAPERQTARMTPERRSRTPEHQSRTPERRPRTPERRPRTPEHQHRTPDHQHRTPEHQHRTPEHQHRTPEHQSRTPEHQSRTPERRFRTPEPTSRIPEPRSRTPEPRPVVPEPRSRLTRLRSRTPEPQHTTYEFQSVAPEPHSRLSRLRSRTPEPQRTTYEFQSRSPELRPRTPGPRSRTPEPHSRTHEFQPRSPEPRFRTPEPRSRTPEHRPTTPKSPRQYFGSESVYSEEDGSESVLLFPELLLSPVAKPVSRPTTPDRRRVDTSYNQEEPHRRAKSEKSDDSYGEDRDRSAYLYPELGLSSETKIRSATSTPANFKFQESSEQEDYAKHYYLTDLPDESQSFSLSEIAEMRGMKTFDKDEFQSVISEPCVTVGKYIVRESVSSTLQSILDKYGDIASGSKLQSMATRSYYLESLSSVVLELKSLPLKSLTAARVEEMITLVRDMESVKIEVGWLRVILTDLAEAVKHVDRHETSIIEKETCDRDLEGKKSEMEEKLKELSLKEKEIKECREKVTEISGRLGRLKMQRTRLTNNLVFLRSKVEKFQGESVLDELF